MSNDAAGQCPSRSLKRGQARSNHFPLHTRNLSALHNPDVTLNPQACTHVVRRLDIGQTPIT